MKLPESTCGCSSVFKNAAVAVLVLFTIACENPVVVSFLTKTGNTIDVTVIVADTSRERQKGLKGRHGLAEREGMLFILAETHRSPEFVMKGMYISIDVVFIGPDMRVAGFIEHAKPGSSKVLTVDENIQYVVEVPAGFVNANGIQKGDIVTIPSNLKPKSY